MMFSEKSESDKLPLHFVGTDVKKRASFSQLCVNLSRHCEVYESLSELSAYPPKHGIIVLDDTPELGGISNAIQRLANIGIWLSVVAIGEEPSPGKIVDAIKAGALDYLVMPVDEERLDRCLTRMTPEALRLSDLRMKQLKAQSLVESLSARETEVLDLLAVGLSNKLIARELGISPRTVEIHRANMMNKLGATHAASAIRTKLEASLPH